MSDYYTPAAPKDNVRIIGLNTDPIRGIYVHIGGRILINFTLLVQRHLVLQLAFGNWRSIAMECIYYGS